MAEIFTEDEYREALRRFLEILLLPTTRRKQKNWSN